MAAVQFVYPFNMAAVTSCEHTLLATAEYTVMGGGTYPAKIDPSTPAGYILRL